MKRRAFTTLIGGAAAWPLVALAQQPDRTRRVGVLMGSAQIEPSESYLAAFFARLEELGWMRGHNILADVRWWNGGPEQMGPVVSEMLALSPEVIMVFTNLALAVVKPMVGSVPVVFVAVGDPVGSGFVASLAHPGGNITGFASYDGPMGGKWLELLKETAPSLTRIMTVLQPDTPIHQAFWRSIEDAAPRMGVEAVPGPVHDTAEIESVVSSFAVKENSGLIVLPHALTQVNLKLLIELELRHHLPSIYAAGGAVKAGGLVSYSFSFDDTFRRTAEYVDRILRGDKPSDLPVQEPARFDLVINLKTAKTLGLDVPKTLLARADEVIE
jgi:putative ABC transport system substrate-binding protein